MTKNQLLQLGGALLLIIAIAAVWVFKVRNAPLPSTPEMGIVSSDAGKMLVPEESAHQKPDSSSPVTEPASLEQPVTRDPFVLPAVLTEVLHQKELAKEEERRRKALQPPPPSVPVQPPNLKLQGILWGTARPQAIINRKIVSVGDIVENAEILSVSREGVMVSFNGQQYPLKLATRGGERGAPSE